MRKTALALSVLLVMVATPAEAKISKDTYKTWRGVYWPLMIVSVLIGGPGAIASAMVQHADEKLARQTGMPLKTTAEATKPGA